MKNPFIDTYEDGDSLADLTLGREVPEDRIPTNRGLLTVSEIMDEVEYGSYAANRGYGISAERLAGFFGEEPAQRMEKRYQAEALARAQRAA